MASSVTSGNLAIIMLSENAADRPYNIRAEKVTNTSISLSWDSSDDADMVYSVHYTKQGK